MTVKGTTWGNARRPWATGLTHAVVNCSRVERRDASRWSVCSCPFTDLLTANPGTLVVSVLMGEEAMAL
jgi:hypothetical protein